MLFSFVLDGLISFVNSGSEGTSIFSHYIARLLVLIKAEHEPPRVSLVDLLAGVITIAPALALALSGTSALPGVLALTGTKPVLGFVDVAVNHELSGFLVLLPVVVVEGFLVVEKLTKVIGESSLSGGAHEGNDSKSEFHF